MANLKPEGDLPRKTDPEKQPGSPSNPPEKSWRDRFPGWETYEGRPNDPRFMTNTDPNKDARYDTNLNPSAVVPRRPGVVALVLGITLGILLLVLLSFLMYHHFRQPSPRSPEKSQSSSLMLPVGIRKTGTA
jgi:hypothetical protein